MLYKDIYVQSLSVSAFSREKGRIFRQKSERRRNTLICVLEGALEFQTQNSTYSVSSGCFLFIPAATAGTTVFLGTENRFVNFIFQSPIPLADIVTVFPACEAVSALLCQTQACCLRNSGSPLFYLSVFYKLLHELTEQENALPDPQYQKLLPALCRIQQHPEENVKVSEYAAQVFMCETGFRRMFREYTGMSPIAYRNEIRLKQIETLLLSGETVANAAASLGFQSLSFYYRCLKQHMHTQKADTPRR